MLRNAWTSDDLDEGTGKITSSNNQILEKSNIFCCFFCHVHPTDHFEIAASEVRDFAVHSSDIQHKHLQHQQQNESFEMPGYVPSPNSIRDTQISQSMQSLTGSVADVEAQSSIPTDSTFLQIHHLNSSTLPANDAAASRDCEHGIFKENTEELLSNSHGHSSSAQRLRSNNPSKNVNSSLIPTPATTTSLDDNPALRLGQDEDPSVIKLVASTQTSYNISELLLFNRSILEDLRAWDTATQLKMTMQKQTQDGLGSKDSINKEINSATAISRRPQTAVQRERTVVEKVAFNRPASAASVFVRHEVSASKQKVEDDDEQDEKPENAAASALSLFDDKEVGIGGAGQVGNFCLRCFRLCTGQSNVMFLVSSCA